MNRDDHSSPGISAILDVVAGSLRDPVTRLRFLKFTAPDPTPKPVRQRRWRRSIALAAIPLLICGVAMLMPPSRTGAPARAANPPEPPKTSIPASARIPPGEVWKIDESGGVETFSNGLRIDDRYTVHTHPRSYLVFPAHGREDVPVHANKPAGIVFHTTESLEAPLTERETRVLQRLQTSLLEYVRRRQSYHFVIDRFGRVYRIVAESDAAFHAGYSIWADATSVYLNLNDSFLGVSFEADTQPGQVEESVTAAQIHSAALLVELLRSRYAIPASNCVTHAQVSVNPSSKRVGYHTDWASSFPYEQVGLPNNYSIPPAAISLFGFECDSAFLRSAGTPQYSGIEAAEKRFRDAAHAANMKLSAYREWAQHRYELRLAAVRRCSTTAE